MIDEVQSITLRQLVTTTAGVHGGQVSVDTAAEDPVGAILGHRWWPSLVLHLLQP